MLTKRLVTALWGLPLLIAAVWFEQPLPWFTLVVAIWGVLATFEFYRLVTASGVSPLTGLGLTWSLLFILSRDSDLRSLLEPYFGLNLLTPLLLTSVLLISLVWLVLRARQKTFTDWAWTMGGMLYSGWLLSFLVALRGLDDGRNWVFFALFTTFASDTAAFFTGRTIGRRRLAPHISPGKTWEGAIGGVLVAIVLSLFFVLPTPVALPLHWGQAIVLGLLVSVFAQLGDLAESLFKRNMGVKDSGKLVPGHGGILDRLDSLLFTGVVVYYYLVWIV